MRKLTDKIQQLAEAGTIDFHRCMFFIKTNAMFIVINIWGILKIPGRTVNLHRHDPVILSGRIIQTTGISHVFSAQHAARIIGSRQCSGRCDCLWILFRLGQVDGNIQFTIFCICLPAHIFRDSISSDIIAVLTELIIPVCCLLRRFFSQCIKMCHHLCRARQKASHQFCIQQISVNN